MITIPFLQTSVVILPTYKLDPDEPSHKHHFPVYSPTTDKLYCPYDGFAYSCSNCANNHPAFYEACKSSSLSSSFRAVLAQTHPEFVL